VFFPSAVDALALSPIAASSGFDYWTVIPSLIGAIAIVGGWCAWLLTRPERRRRSLREEQFRDQLGAEVAEMGDALADLKTMVTSLAEDMQGRAPRPQLRFATKQGPTSAVVVRIPGMPTVDIEHIVSAEREAARATRRPLANQPIVPADTPKELRSALEAMSKIESISKRALGSGFASASTKYLPVTDEDYATFEKELDKYEREVRSFVDDWLDYLSKRRFAIALTAQIDNGGGAPADKARVKIIFPNPCHETEWPERPKLPVRPKFKRRLNPLHHDYRLGALGLGAFPSLSRMPDVKPINFKRDHSGPNYREGSLTVSYDYDSLPHHDTVELDHFIVGIPEPGTYAVRWTIGAKNLVRLEEGTLEVEVIHEDADLRPVASLNDLVRTRHSAAG
jgi:hypothetical protein